MHMVLKLKTIFFLAAFLISLNLGAQSTDLNFLLDKYVTSINQADSTLGKKFWSQGKEVSFINPRGNEYGWNGIRNIYAMFEKAFSKRDLKYTNAHWTNYGEFAWVDFNWVFDAEFTANRKTVQTKGRETQIWRKEHNEWKLIHVHYSGMPVTGQNQGF